ncbi:hypothetical protein RB595_009956 [Gaeumannomyces hyphopodioides]
MTQTSWDPEPSLALGPARAGADKSEAVAVIKDLRARLAAAEGRLSAMEDRLAALERPTAVTKTKTAERAVEWSLTRAQEVFELIMLGHEKSKLAWKRNYKVTAATGRLWPVYSPSTGREIGLCPKSIAELKKMGASDLKPLLQALRVQPLDMTDEEMREVVQDHMGISRSSFNAS